MFLLETHKMNKFRTSGGKKDFKFKFIVIGCLFACYSAFGGVFSSEEPHRNGMGRKLLFHEDGGPVNCTSPAIDEFPPDFFTLEQRRQGAIFLHFFLTCYLFILLAYVCDDYFVPSIKTLCDRLNMSEDVAGATFMAAATSSPELFINIVGTFVTKGDIGVGAIVGSAVFNILAVPACCGLFGGQSVKIDWWPLTRDCFAYGVTVVLLIISLHDGHIDWYEALILVVLYVFYIIAMYYNDAVSRKVKRLVKRKVPYKQVNLQHEATPLLKEKIEFKLQVEDVNGWKTSTSTPTESQEPTDGNADHPRVGQVIPLFTVVFVPGEALQIIPKGFWSKCCFFLSWPISFMLFLTIPDCKQEKHQKLWPLTFIMCIAWIASTSYLVAWMITIMGNTLSIPDSVMGLTFLAAGMSVPEATSSVIVTNQGHGAMGISSSIGSNTFDILLCLGLPWLIKSTFFPAESGNHIVKINSQGLGYSAMSLLTTLTLLYSSFLYNNFTLDRKIGLICFMMYILFLVFASLIELNVFFEVNLPLCGS